VDIAVAYGSDVVPGTGGMSVAPDWRLLAPWRIPRRLGHVVPNARGRNEDACWRLGNSEFVAGAITQNLSLAIDQPTHGTIEPRYAMRLDEFQNALASTRDMWEIDES
jgi:hypothetical protein